ncbi:MAG: hypothetical protein R3E55_06095 [Burkholderiaceae bacterium]
MFSVLALGVAGARHSCCWPCWAPRRASIRAWCWPRPDCSRLVSSAAGIALGTLLAAAALRLLGGDLGGGYRHWACSRHCWSGAAALLYSTLGVAAALAGGWWPARSAQRCPGADAQRPGHAGPLGRARLDRYGFNSYWRFIGRRSTRFGMPLAAYVAVGLLLVEGGMALPWAVAGLLRLLRPLARFAPGAALLALERARRMRGSAAIAIGGGEAGQPEPGRGADGDGGELAARCSSGSTPCCPRAVPALGPAGPPRRKAALLPATLSRGWPLPGVERVERPCAPARYSSTRHAPPSRYWPARWAATRPSACPWWTPRWPCRRGAPPFTSTRRWWICTACSLAWTGPRFHSLLAFQGNRGNRHQLLFHSRRVA